MTLNAMPQQRGKTYNLRVIQMTEGHYFVESSDSRVAYKTRFTAEETSGTCPDFQNHLDDPEYLCKHLLAIVNCLPEGAAAQQEYLQRPKPQLDERFIKHIGGQELVLYAGLLDLAHQKGLVKMKVEILQNPTAENGHLAIVRALAESRLGEAFMDVGDAAPANCGSKVVQHLLGLASTRAKARALRDFTNLGMACLEELGGLHGSVEAAAAPRQPGKPAARKAQANQTQEAPKA
jgi:hypothetical protein